MNRSARNIVLLLLCVFFFSLLSGCRLLGSTRNVTIHIPRERFWETAGFEKPWYLLEWPNMHGEISSAYVSAGTDAVEITVDKGADIPIRLRPYGLWEGPGGWVGAYCPKGEVFLCCCTGKVPSLIIDLWPSLPQRTARLSLSSWSAAYRQLMQKVLESNTSSVQLPGIDCRELRLSVMTGEFTSNSLKLLPMKKLSVDGLERGRWVYADNPAVSFWSSPPQPMDIELSYPGSYVFYQEGGSGKLSFFLDRQGYVSQVIEQEAKRSFTARGENTYCKVFRQKIR